MVGLRNVAVVGAGIIGASVTYHLARLGVRAHCIDRAEPGSGTTSASFSRSKVYRKVPREYFELNRAAGMEHARLASELGPAPWWHPCGSLIWANDDDFVGHVELLRRWGAKVALIEAKDVAQPLEPNVDFGSTGTPVAYFPEEAWIDAPALVSRLLDLAQAAGGNLRTGLSVVGIEFDKTRPAAIRLSDGEWICVDAVVNAAGPEADRVAALAGAPLKLCAGRTGLLVDLAVERDPIQRILQSPRVSVRPLGPGRLQLRADEIDAELAAGPQDARVDDLAQDLSSLARQVIPSLADARIEATRIGKRAIPSDGYASVGALSAVPGYFEAVSHSGVNLGPLIGRLLAEQIVSGIPDRLLRRFAPDRFLARPHERCAPAPG
ncbi:MAG: hypothetical protein V7607_1697 [Solirubrobacteraceae bacterium]